MQRAGFTIVELAVVLGILATILGIATINLTTIQHKTYLSTTVDTVVADIDKQRIKAMIGETEGRADHDRYGVYFEIDRYTLFHGSSYSPAELSNAVVMLDNNMNFSATTFSQSQVVFNGVSGEINNFVAGNNTVTLLNTVTNEQKTITINRYGVITAIN